MRWGWSYDDLNAIGIKASPEQVDVIDGGGQVLSLEALPVPEAFCCCGETHDWPQKAADSSLVMMPVLFRSQVRDAPWYPGCSESAQEIYEGHEDDSWRQFPSALSETIHSLVETDECDLEERQTPVRVWSFTPEGVPGFEELSDKILTAGRRAIVFSGWEDLREFYQWENRMAEDEEDPSQIDEDKVEEYWALRNDLVNRCLIRHFPSPSDPWGWTPDNDPVVPPLERFLDDRRALELWKRLLYQSRAGFHRVSNHLPLDSRGTYLSTHLRSDPWYSH